MNHIAINARLGDGMIHFRGKNASFSMQSKIWIGLQLKETFV